MKRLYFSLAPVAPKKHITLMEAYRLVTLLEIRGTRHEIANRIAISIKTLDVHLAELRRAFGCKNKEELIKKGLQCDWKKWNQIIKSKNPKPFLTGQRSAKYQKTMARKATLPQQQAIQEITRKTKSPKQPLIIYYLFAKEILMTIQINDTK